MQVDSPARADRVWFITGASSGFGRALSRAVLERGERLVATGRELDSIEALVAPAAERSLALPLDVADANTARRVVKAAVARFGRIDVVFNNAGYGHVGAAEELSDAELRRQIDVNLFGVINVTRAVLPYLRQQRSGHLLQMSSLNGVEGLAGGAYYAASKFGIVGFSRSLADEVAPFGIKVTIIEPAPFRTRFLNDKSAKWAKPMPEYEESVGKARETLRSMDGRQPGDPERAAHALMRIVNADRPPLHLPLGRMAIEHIRANLDAELKELGAWAELGAATDFPDDEQADPNSSKSGAARAHEELVRRTYSAFNGREINTALALMDPNVDWPNVPDGGFVHGREEVGRHWREQFAQADPRIEVDELSETGPNRVEAHVQQVVRDRNGKKISDDRLVHVFTIANDQIKRLDVRPERRL